MYKSNRRAIAIFRDQHNGLSTSQAIVQKPPGNGEIRQLPVELAIRIKERNQPIEILKACLTYIVGHLLVRLKSTLDLRSLHGGAELQVMAVGVVEIDRRGWHPLMAHRPPDHNALLLQLHRSRFKSAFVNRERKMLFWPCAFVFLNHYNPGSTCAQEEPSPAFIPKADFQTQNFPI